MTVTVPDVLGWLAENPNAATAIATFSVAVIAVVSLILELRRGRRERQLVDDRIRAGAYVVREHIRSWRDRIAAIKGGAHEERKDTIEAIWEEMGPTGERLENLLMESSRASEEVAVPIAQAVVEYHRAVSHVRPSMTIPRFRKTISRGNTVGALTDIGMKSLMDPLRACNRSLGELVPDDVEEAQKSPWPFEGSGSGVIRSVIR